MYRNPMVAGYGWAGQINKVMQNVVIHYLMVEELGKRRDIAGS